MLICLDAIAILRRRSTFLLPARCRYFPNLGTEHL
jgi:hypothetical protein